MASPGMFLQRMSGREKRLVAAMVILMVLGGTSIAYIILHDKIQGLEETLSDGKMAVEQIQMRSEDYVVSQKRKKALEQAIKKNDPRIQTAIDSVARTVQARTPSPSSAGTTFDRRLRYEAKTTERPIVLGSTGKKQKRKTRNSEFRELSQPAEYSFVKFVDLVRFLEQIESPERLMYVSKLVITKKYKAPEFVQGNLTISTFIHRPQEEEEED